MWWKLALVWYALLSAVALVAYALDKRASLRPGRRRTPERTLHTLELLGGWPGALLAQRLYRHKTRKPRYQLIFRLIVAAHLTAWAALAYAASR